MLKQLISGEGLVIVIKYSMKAPWLERISAGVSWFSEGQPGKAQDCENTEAWGHHQPAPTITSVLYNFRKNISNIHSLSFSQIVTGSNTTCTSRYSQMSRHRFLFQTKCEKKSNRQRHHVFPGYLFITEMPWLWCYQSCIDQIWLSLDEHMFLFYRAEKKLQKLMMIKIFAFFCVLRR